MYVCIISMYMNKKYVEDKLLILSYKKEDRYIYYIINNNIKH